MFIVYEMFHKVMGTGFDCNCFKIYQFIIISYATIIGCLIIQIKLTNP